MQDTIFILFERIVINGCLECLKHLLPYFLCGFLISNTIPFLFCISTLTFNKLYLIQFQRKYDTYLKYWCPFVRSEQDNKLLKTCLKHSFGAYFQAWHNIHKIIELFYTLVDSWFEFCRKEHVELKQKHCRFFFLSVFLLYHGV